MYAFITYGHQDIMC